MKMKHIPNKPIRQFVFSFVSIAVGIAIFVIIVCLRIFQVCDILYFLLHIVCVVTCFVVSFVTNVLEVNTKSNVIIYKKAMIRKGVWLKSYIVWLVIHYWLITASLLGTINVIYVTIDSVDQIRIVLYSILSLFITSASYAISPVTMAEGYRIAYCKLDSAILCYEKANDNNGIDKLIEAMELGEEIITSYSFYRK